MWFDSVSVVCGFSKEDISILSNAITEFAHWLGKSNVNDQNYLDRVDDLCERILNLESRAL